MDTGLCGPKLGLLWGDVTESRVDPLAIVVAFDVGEQVPFGSFACRVAFLVDQLRFRCPEETLHGRVVAALPLRVPSSSPCGSWTARCRGPSRLCGTPPRQIDCHGRSNARGRAGGRRRWIAMVRAASGSSVRMWSRIAQPTTLRLNRSRMTARYNQPSSVGSGVGSAEALPLPEPYVHLSAHTALHSTLAQGHGDIMISGGDGTSKLVPEDVGVSLRVAPPELSLGAGDQPAQSFTDRVALCIPTMDQPSF